MSLLTYSVLSPRTVAIGLWLAALTALGAPIHEKVSIGKEPDWVRPASQEAKSALPDTDSSEVILLQDRQINVQQAQNYWRSIRRILNASGVQNGSRVTIMFDPSYASLQLHRIEIRRKEKVLNRLAPEKVRILQREDELDRHLYHGNLSVLVVLDDVRVGDEIDCSYTISGKNPVFGNKFSDSLVLRWPMAIQHLRYRLLWPAGRTLHLDPSGTEHKPVITEAKSGAEYVWELTDLRSLFPEPRIPSSYDPYPRVHLSEFGTWHEVARWAAPLYAIPSELSSEMEDQIRTWKQSFKSAEEQLLAALQFVQDEVRYFGIEMGPQSHQPTDPVMVFERRYGDCKDKAVLLCAMLRRLGIEATPALVHTRRIIEQRHPSPLAFNHAIVCAKLDNKEIWLDPTLSFQRGPLNSRFLPNYRHALIVHPETKALARVRERQGVNAQTVVRELLTLHGTNEAAELKVVMTMEGLDAEEYRGSMAEIGSDLLGKNTAAAYARYYPLLETNCPFQMRDDPERNTIQVTDTYSIPGVWQKGDGWAWSCQVYAQSIANVLDVPISSQRQMPVGIQHPCRRLHTMIVNLPQQVRLSDESKVIRGPADELRYKRASFGRSMTIEFEYRSLADAVPITRLADHVKARTEMLQCLGTSLSWVPKPALAGSTTVARPKGPFAWIVVGFAVVMFIVWLRQRQQSDY